jgi:hypothetical protein
MQVATEEKDEELGELDEELGRKMQELQATNDYLKTVMADLSVSCSASLCKSARACGCLCVSFCNMSKLPGVPVLLLSMLHIWVTCCLAFLPMLLPRPPAPYLQSKTDRMNQLAVDNTKLRAEVERLGRGGAGQKDKCEWQGLAEECRGGAVHCGGTLVL